MSYCAHERVRLQTVSSRKVHKLRWRLSSARPTKVLRESRCASPMKVLRESRDLQEVSSRLRLPACCGGEYSSVEIRDNAISRREGLIGTLGVGGLGLLLTNYMGPVSAIPAVDWVLFKGAQGELSPISCTRPKDPTRAAPRGSSITAPKNFEFVDPCPLGGYTLSTPWSFWGPTALQPMTGFRVGPNPLDTSGPESPDPSGTLDARIESEYGILLVQALPSRAGDPWIGKADMSNAGSPEDVLQALNPQLLKNLVQATSTTDAEGRNYYTYELNNTATKFANRRIVKVAMDRGVLIGFDARCNDSQWDRSEQLLKSVVSTFRLGTTNAPMP